MSYPTFNTLDSAQAFADEMWINKMRGISQAHEGKIIHGDNKENVVDFDSLSRADKVNLKSFGYCAGKKVYHKGATVRLVVVDKKYNEDLWFINVDVDADYPNYLANTVRDGSVSSIPEDWFESEQV